MTKRLLRIHGLLLFTGGALLLPEQAWAVRLPYSAPQRVGQTECFYTPANLLTPTVGAKATRSDGALVFAYRISNAATSLEDAQRFALENRLDTPRTSEPSGWKMHPFRLALFLKWTELSPGNESVIPPGGSLEGFDVMAVSLPGILRWHVQGFVESMGDAICASEGWAETEDPEDAKLDFFSNSVPGRTVGAVPLPETFEPLAFLATMLDLKNQSFALGWIKDEAVSQEIGSRLSAISSQLSAIQDQKIPVTTGRQVLELAAQFMQYVESVSCKQFECETEKPLTSEAYALLYFNMDYFATQVAKACNVPPPVIEPSPKRRPAKAGKSATADRPAPKPSKK